MWVGPSPEKNNTGVFDIFCSLVPFKERVYSHKGTNNTFSLRSFNGVRGKAYTIRVCNARDPSSRPPFSEIILPHISYYIGKTVVFNKKIK